MGWFDFLFPWRRGYEKKSALDYMRFKSFTFLGRYISIAVAPRAVRRLAIDSRVPGVGYQKHVFLADIDTPLPVETVISRLSDFQRTHVLPDIYLIRSKSGYHVYCLRMFSLLDYIRLLADLMDLVDVKFLSWVARRHKGILRVEGDDLRHVATLQGRSTSMPCSLSHAKFLESRFGIEVDRKQSSEWVFLRELKPFSYLLPRGK